MLLVSMKPEARGGPSSADSEKESPLSRKSNFTPLQWCLGLNAVEMHQYCSASYVSLL